jgi:cytoskeletal protein RodZ
MVKLPFRRNNSANTQVPQEISDYYQAEKKQRVGVAWLLSIATFIITVVIVLGLFFVGRVIYRAVTNKHTTKPAPTAANNDSGNSTKTDVTAPAPTSGTSAPSSSSTVTQPASPTTVQKTPTQVPNTGPGNIAAVFLGVSIVGTVAYQIVLRRRLSQ